MNARTAPINPSSRIDGPFSAPQPSRIRLRPDRLLALGLIAAGLGFMAERGQQQAGLVSSLEQKAGDVQHGLQAGDINPSSVRAVTAPESGYASAVAQDVSTPSATGEVSDIMTAQEGGSTEVTKGDKFVLPAGDVPAAIK